MTPFQLTMPEPKPERAAPYQWSDNAGTTWRPIGEAALLRALERLAAFPDNARLRIDDGETVRLHPDRGYFVRRTPTAAEAADASRQCSLWAVPR